jgi:HD-like signal output (HDOD) protein
MKRILFVDDEPQILDGLQNLLRKQRKQWDMVFAEGGQAALCELEKSAFDVVVSDMRMPGIDGATLLTRVKEMYPASARIILSGHAERDSIVRALPVAHQFLSKPCDAVLLRVVVERACELQRLLQNEGIRAVIGKLDKLPSAPTTYWELTRVAARSDVAIGDLAEIIEQDPAMTVKVLQLVNSGYFGMPQKLSSVRQAVSYLGTDLLKALALTVHAFGTLGAGRIAGFSLEELQAHAVQTARLVKRMVSDPKQAGEAFTAAMVHDVGRLVLAVGVPEIVAQAVQEERLTGRASYLIERDLLGVSHAEVGAYLLGAWGLPLSIVEAVAYHHTPSLVKEGAAHALAYVHIADALLGGQSGVHVTKSAPTLLDLEFVERAGLSHRLEELWQLAESFKEGGAQK